VRVCVCVCVCVCVYVCVFGGQLKGQVVRTLQMGALGACSGLRGSGETSGSFLAEALEELQAANTKLEVEKTRLQLEVVRTPSRQKNLFFKRFLKIDL
jgi:hypothetical protein